MIRDSSLENPGGSVHARLVRLLEQTLGDRARIADVLLAGTEEVVLALVLEEAPPSAEARGAGGGHTATSAAGAARGRTAASVLDAPRSRATGGATDAGRSRELHLSLLSPAPLFWLSASTRDRTLPASGFGDWMRRRLVGARISRVSAGDSGRILRLDVLPRGEDSSGKPQGHEAREQVPADELPHADTDAADDTPAALILDPIPNACRLLILDAAGRVVQRHPPTIHASPTGRGTPGAVYAEPAGRPTELWERMEFATSTAADSPVDATPSDRGTEANELHVCIALRAGGRSSDAPQVIGESGDKAPIVFLSPRPCARTAAPDTASVEPAPLEVRSSSPLPPWEAARRAGELYARLARLRLYRRHARQILTREQQYLIKLEAKLQVEMAEAGEGRLLRRQAEALLANAGRVPKGAARARIDDPAAHGEKIEFELDPRLSFSQNAARLFRRAARLERALPQRERRMTQAQALRKAIGRWLSAPILSDPWYSLSDGRTGNMRPGGKDPSLQDARRMLAGIETGLRKRWQRALEEWEQASRERSQPLDQAGYDARRGGGARREARAAAGRPRESATAGRRTARGAGLAAGDRAASVERDAAAGGVHPRKFELPGGWVVLVGRSNRENDVLTHRLARPNDLWFHARGAAGSHVVLRRGGRKDNPPRDIISRTAAIAAYFSKARTSAMVPVIYTEKRHVRKPRKGAPGLALCTHEKVVMVAPGLP